ncbi:MAG: hypothetical protein AAFY56_21795, partial [Pseudomonadota bacterium]
MTLRIAVWVVICVIALEVLLRLFYMGHKPILSHEFIDGIPVLPADRDITVKFPSSEPQRYVTDEYHARIAAPLDKTASGGRDGDILVVGDSQAMGYLVDYEDTFASIAASKLLQDHARARILAAPNAEPYSSLRNLRRYKEQGQIGKPHCGVVVLNLSNDLDELFVPPINSGNTPPIRRWLLRHSVAYMTWVKINTLVVSKEYRGINESLVLLDPAERLLLATKVVALITEQVRELESAERVAVVVIPTSYQVEPQFFDLLRGSYISEEHFEQWKNELPNLVRMMGALESYIISELRR